MCHLHHQNSYKICPLTHFLIFIRLYFHYSFQSSFTFTSEDVTHQMWCQWKHIHWYECLVTKRHKNWNIVHKLCISYHFGQLHWATLWFQCWSLESLKSLESWITTNFNNVFIFQKLNENKSLTTPLSVSHSCPYPAWSALSVSGTVATGPQRTLHTNTHAHTQMNKNTHPAVGVWKRGLTRRSRRKMKIIARTNDNQAWNTGSACFHFHIFSITHGSHIPSCS